MSNTVTGRIYFSFVLATAVGDDNIPEKERKILLSALHSAVTNLLQVANETRTTGKRKAPASSYK